MKINTTAPIRATEANIGRSPLTRPALKNWLREDVKARLDLTHHFQSVPDDLDKLYSSGIDFVKQVKHVAQFSQTDVDEILQSITHSPGTAEFVEKIAITKTWADLINKEE
jgi:hypothetical protein